MEIIDRLQDLLANYWDKVLLWITTPIIAGFSIWKIGTILVKLIQNRTARKYTQKVQQLRNEIVEQVSQFKEEVKAEIKQDLDAYSKEIDNKFNRLQEKELAKKEEIYAEIFEGKQLAKQVIEEVKEVEQDIVEEIKEEPKKEEKKQPKEEKVELL